MASASHHTLVSYPSDFEPAMYDTWCHQDFIDVEPNPIETNIADLTPPETNSQQFKRRFGTSGLPLRDRTWSTESQPSSELHKRQRSIATEAVAQEHAASTLSISSSTGRRPSNGIRPHNQTNKSSSVRDGSSTSPPAKAATDKRRGFPTASPLSRRRGVAMHLPSFIRPLSSRIGPDEISYFAAKGTFWLPSACDLLTLVETYAHFVHPFNPFLDIKNLLDVCRRQANPSGETTRTRSCDRISLLTLNATLGAATLYVDTTCIKRMNFASHIAARDAFYVRAKLLLDMESESDLLNIQQALLLMTFWMGIPEVAKDMWHWHVLAVDSLKSLNFLEPTSPGVTPQGRSRSLQKRLWWSSFIRDACLSLGLRYAPRMEFDERTKTMLTLTDFDDIPIRVAQDKSKSASSQRFCFAQRTLALAFIQMTKLSLIINGVRSFIPDSHIAGALGTTAAPCCGVDHATTASIVTDLFAQRLESWQADLPAECRYNTVDEEDHEGHGLDMLEASVKIQVILVNMFYHCVICHLHLPQLLKETGNNIGRLYDEGMTKSMSVDMIRNAVQELTAFATIASHNQLIDHLPSSISMALMPPIAIFLAVVHSKSLSKQPRAPIIQALGTCLTITAALAKKHESAQLMMARFGKSLEDSGLQLDDVLLSAQQKLQTKTVRSHIASTPASAGSVPWTILLQNDIGSRKSPRTQNRNSPGLNEADRIALNDMTHHVHLSTDWPVNPNPVAPSTSAPQAKCFDYLFGLDGSPMPAVDFTDTGLGEAISDIEEALPSSSLLGSLENSSMLQDSSDFSFEDFDAIFNIDPSPPF